MLKLSCFVLKVCVFGFVWLAMVTKEKQLRNEKTCRVSTTCLYSSTQANFHNVVFFFLHIRVYIVLYYILYILDL